MGPVLVGPVEFGLLRHIPGMGTPIGSDHFVVVIEVDDATVTFHDPHGHPYATLPVERFVGAWRAETVPYPSTPFTMRAGFHRTRDVDVPTAFRLSLPEAVRWLEGAGQTVERFAEFVTAGLDEGVDPHGHLVHFAVRVGARRLADASAWLGTIGQQRGRDRRNAGETARRPPVRPGGRRSTRRGRRIARAGPHLRATSGRARRPRQFRPGRWRRGRSRRSIRYEGGRPNIRQLPRSRDLRQHVGDALEAAAGCASSNKKPFARAAGTRTRDQ